MISWQLARNILIYGYAREGRSSAAFLKRTLPRVRIDIHDDHLPAFATPPDFASYDVIVLSSGIPRSVVPFAHRSRCINILELFFSSLSEKAKGKVIGVSGTKGKSTTVTFITECLTMAGLRAVSAGNIGVPVLDVLPKLNSNKLDYVVLELSSYQLEFLRVSPPYSIFLNLYQDHLDRHGTMARYFKSKQHLWRHQRQGDILFVPRRWKKLIAPSVGAHPKQEVVYTNSADPHMFKRGSIFRAEYWLENFGAANALLRRFGIEQKVIAKAAAVFKGLPHRLEHFTTVRGIEFYDDSIAVNIDATLAGLRFLQARLGSVIIGGSDRKQNFLPLIRFLVDRRIAVIILRSQTSARIEELFQKFKYKKYTVVDTILEAAQTAFAFTPARKICVLSCGAPSFGMFKNFEDRGNKFKQAVYRQVS